MLHPIYRLSTAASLWFSIALPIRELRAEHASATSPVSLPTHGGSVARTAGAKLTGRATGRLKRAASLLVEVWTELRALARHLGPSDSADDIVQEALMRAWAAGAFGTLSFGTVIYLVTRRRKPKAEHRATIPNTLIQASTEGAAAQGNEEQDDVDQELPTALGSYLRSVVRNVAREYWRQTKRTRTIAPEEADEKFAVGAWEPADRVIDAESSAQVTTLLDRLQPRHREVVLRHWALEQTFPEIAGAMGISIAAATKCWQRTLGSLRTDPRWQQLAEA